MTKIGIIGCGSISRFHQEGYARAGAQIAMVCDVSPAAAQELAARCGARAVTDYRQVLADPEVELVSVLTPSSTHKAIALAAIEAGKGVVCEKTLTDNASDSADLAQAAKRGTFFATAFMKRFFPAAAKAKELLNGMGAVVSMHVRTWHPFTPVWEDVLPDTLSEHPSWIKRSYSGGVLICGGSHVLDLIHWYGGRPTRVAGHMGSRGDLDVERQCNAMLWLPDGGVAHLECLWHPYRRTGYERNGWDERVEINTPSGRLTLTTVTWNTPEKNGALLVHEDAHSGVVTEYRYDAVSPFEIEMAEMLRRFETHQPAFPSAVDGYVVDELVEQITAGAKTGKVVPITYRH